MTRSRVGTQPLLSALSRAFAVQIGEAGEWVIPNNDKVNSSQLWLSKPGISEMVARQLYELVLPGLEKALGAKHLTTLTAHLNRAEHVVETWSALQPLNLT